MSGCWTLWSPSFCGFVCFWRIPLFRNLISSEIHFRLSWRSRLIFPAIYHQWMDTDIWRLCHSAGFLQQEFEVLTFGRALGYDQKTFFLPSRGGCNHDHRCWWISLLIWNLFFSPLLRRSAGCVAPPEPAVWNGGSAEVNGGPTSPEEGTSP